MTATRRKSRCVGKTPFATKELALLHLFRLVIKNGAFMAALQAYRCKEHWHVGHRPRYGRKT